MPTLLGYKVFRNTLVQSNSLLVNVYSVVTEGRSKKICVGSFSLRKESWYGLIVLHRRIGLLHSILIYRIIKQKIERDSSVTLTRGSLAGSLPSGLSFDSDSSIGHVKARSSSRRAAELKAAGQERATHFRVARIGPGWVLGSMEGASGHQNTGNHVAGTCDAAVSVCFRLSCCHDSAHMSVCSTNSESLPTSPLAFLEA